MELVHARRVEDLFFVAQDVRKLERPVLGEFGSLEQGIDQPRSLVSRRIGDELPGLICGRQNAEGVEKRPADERGVVADGRWTHLEFLEPGEDLLVDVVGRLRCLPHEVWPRRKKCQPHGKLGGEITDDNRRLAELFAMHEAAMAGADGGIGRLVDRKPGHIATRAVDESGRDLQLHVIVRIDEDRFRRRPRDAGELWQTCIGSLRSGRDPIPQDAVFQRVVFEPHPPFVCQLAARLGQNQAGVRIEEIEAPLRCIARQGRVIPRRIFAAKRELEATLAVGIAMAGAQVAAGLGENRHHVAVEGDAINLGCECRPNRTDDCCDNRQPVQSRQSAAEGHWQTSGDSAAGGVDGRGSGRHL
jgi:hypothetical protein